MEMINAPSFACYCVEGFGFWSIACDKATRTAGCWSAPLLSGENTFTKNPLSASQLFLSLRWYLGLAEVTS